MSTWTARFSYEINFEAADANEADEIMQRIVDAETVFGHPIVARSKVYIARREVMDDVSNQDKDSDGWYENSTHTAILQSLGACGLVSPDGRFACIKDLGHEGPHGSIQDNDSE